MLNQSKKISLLVSSISNAGGCERITCNLANELGKRNYSVTIINVYNSNTSFFPLEKNVSVLGVYKKPVKPSKYHFPFIPLRVLSLLSKKKNRPDILIGVATDMCLYALPSLLFLGIKFISLEQFNFNANTHFFARLGRKLSARYAEALVVLTTKDKMLFEENMHVKGILTCIPNFTTFHPQYPSAINSNTAIAVGRYTRQKGFDTLIQIWQKVAAQCPDWQLKIIGKGEDKEMLAQMIAERSLDSVVTLVPLSSAISEYYKEASVFLLSSRWEGLPLVMVEAKSFGLPMVSFDCETGPRDVIENGEDGILIADQDINAFAAALIGLLPNRQRLHDMSRRAIRNNKHFAPEAVIPLWEHLFDAITRKN